MTTFMYATRTIDEYVVGRYYRARPGPEPSQYLGDPLAWLSDPRFDGSPAAVDCNPYYNATLVNNSFEHTTNVTPHATPILPPAFCGVHTPPTVSTAFTQHPTCGTQQPDLRKCASTSVPAVFEAKAQPSNEEGFDALLRLLIDASATEGRTTSTSTSTSTLAAPPAQIAGNSQTPTPVASTTHVDPRDLHAYDPYARDVSPSSPDLFIRGRDGAYTAWDAQESDEDTGGDDEEECYRVPSSAKTGRNFRALPRSVAAFQHNATYAPPNAASRKLMAPNFHASSPSTPTPGPSQSTPSYFPPPSPPQSLKRKARTHPDAPPASRKPAAVHCEVPNCNHIANSRTELTKHYVVHIPSGHGAWECPNCRERFKRDDPLRRHLRKSKNVDCKKWHLEGAMWTRGKFRFYNPLEGTENLYAIINRILTNGF